MMGLWPAHWAEVAADRDKFNLDPDLDRYAEMEWRGILHVVTARKRGELVGYYVWIVGTLLHHRTILTAMSDMYWLRPDCRKGFSGIRFIRFSEAYAKSLGVKKLFATFQPWLSLEGIYQRLGWIQAERVYCKIIGS
jgi:hypothetical protein